MQNLFSILSVVLLFFVSCKERDNSFNIQITDTSKTFKREIPVYTEGRSKGDTDYLFKVIKQDASALKLDFIENGFDFVQIRVWLGHSLAVKRNVVVLKQTSGKWLGQIITYSYGHDDINGKEFISNKEVEDVDPKSGWANFIKVLMDLQILTLPNGQDLKDYNSCGGADGIDYFFEMATPKKYRFFYYCNPDENSNQFWQVKNVVEFSNLLEKEFRFKYTR